MNIVQWQNGGLICLMSLVRFQVFIRLYSSMVEHATFNRSTKVRFLVGTLVIHLHDYYRMIELLCDHICVSLNGYSTSFGTMNDLGSIPSTQTVSLKSAWANSASGNTGHLQCLIYGSIPYWSTKRVRCFGSMADFQSVRQGSIPWIRTNNMVGSGVTMV